MEALSHSNASYLERLTTYIVAFVAAALIVRGGYHYVTYQYERDRSHVMSNHIEQIESFVSTLTTESQGKLNPEVNIIRHDDTAEWIDVRKKLGVFSDKMRALLSLHPIADATRKIKFKPPQRGPFEQVTLLYGFSDQIVKNKLGGKIKILLFVDGKVVFEKDIHHRGLGMLYSESINLPATENKEFEISITPLTNNVSSHHFYVDLWYR